MKLIDWSRMPTRGVMTNGGEFISTAGDWSNLLTCGDRGQPYVRIVRTERLRLIESQTWLPHDGGPCPLPPGLIVEVRIPRRVTYGGLGADTPRRAAAAQSTSEHDLWRWLWRACFAYRIIGVDRPGGWTDDPSEATG